MRQISYALLAAACCGATAQTPVAASPHQTMYRVTILSSAGAAGNSINDLGLIGGSYTLANNSIHASLWAFGKQIDLGTLGTGAALSSRVQWPVKNVLGLISGISLTDTLDPNQEGWSCGFFLPNPNFNVCLGFVWDPLTRKMRPLSSSPACGGSRRRNRSSTTSKLQRRVAGGTCRSRRVLGLRGYRRSAHALRDRRRGSRARLR